MKSIFSVAIALSFLIGITRCLPVAAFEGDDWKKVKTFDPGEDLLVRVKASSGVAAATTRMRATTVTQSINNWIQDVNTVDSFLDVALGLPIGGPLKAGASKALAFAQDEPVNLKFLKATPGLDAAGLAAAGVLEKVFGDVLDQLGNVVDKPASLPVAVNAVAQINVNR
jgi:hypothetical protein